MAGDWMRNKATRSVRLFAQLCTDLHRRFSRLVLTQDKKKFIVSPD